MNDIYSYIDRYEYVSFDIFDTLLCRDVNDYRRVFDLVARRADLPGSTDFKWKRVFAAQKARELAGGREITLDEIYEQMEEYSKAEKERLKGLEKDTEKAILTANEKIRKIYQYCVKQKKKIVIISDMYLDKDFLSDLLIEKGYIGFFKLYVSSEYGEEKKTGRLFQIVLGDLGIKASQMIHIGDNLRRDFLAPGILGIRSIWSKSTYKRTMHRTQDRMDLERFSKNHCRYIDPFEKIGYLYYGPFLYGFVLYLITALEKENFDKVLFMARDGYVIQRAYDLFVKLGKVNVPSVYFMGSRRSLQVPLLASLKGDFDIFFKIASFSAYTSVNRVLERMGYSGNFLKKYDENISLSKIKEMFLDPKELVNEKKLILSNAEKEQNGLIRYLKETGIVGKKCLLVDVGWKCSLQTAINRILKEQRIKSKISGIYCGFYTNEETSKKDAKGFLFTTDRREENFYVTKGAVGIMELFFSAPHGSANHYTESGVECETYEYWDEKKYGFEKDVVEKLQRGALDFVNDLLGSPLSQIIECDSETAFYKLKRLMKRPTLREVSLFENYQFVGANGLIPILPWKGYVYYIRHPRKLLIDYCQSVWKIGFIKKMLMLPQIEYPLFYLSYKFFEMKGKL